MFIYKFLKSFLKKTIDLLLYKNSIDLKISIISFSIQFNW